MLNTCRAEHCPEGCTSLPRQSKSQDSAKECASLCAVGLCGCLGLFGTPRGSIAQGYSAGLAPVLVHYRSVGQVLRIAVTGQD